MRLWLAPSPPVARSPYRAELEPRPAGVAPLYQCGVVEAAGGPHNRTVRTACYTLIQSAGSNLDGMRNISAAASMGRQRLVESDFDSDAVRYAFARSATSSRSEGRPCRHREAPIGGQVLGELGNQVESFLVDQPRDDADQGRGSRSDAARGPRAQRARAARRLSVRILSSSYGSAETGRGEVPPIDVDAIQNACRFAALPRGCPRTQSRTLSSGSPSRRWAHGGALSENAMPPFNRLICPQYSIRRSPSLWPTPAAPTSAANFPDRPIVNRNIAGIRCSFATLA